MFTCSRLATALLLALLAVSLPAAHLPIAHQRVQAGANAAELRYAEQIGGSVGPLAVDDRGLLFAGIGPRLAVYDPAGWADGKVPALLGQSEVLPGRVH